MNIHIRTPVLQAAVWMGLALLSLVMMAISARELSRELTTLQILFLRSALSMLLVAVMVYRKGGIGILPTRRPGIHLLRNLAHFGGQYAWIVGLASISMAEVFALEFTTPIWALFIAAFFLGEKISVPRVVALVAGVIGVLLILRPGFNTIEPATWLVLAGAVGFATAHAGTKTLVKEHHPVNILFWMCAIHLLLSSLPALLYWQAPSSVSWFWLGIMACGSVLTHYSQSRAFALADAMVVIPLDFLRLPLIAVVGFLFYQEGIDWLVMFGALIMFGGNLVNIRAERKVYPKVADTEEV